MVRLLRISQKVEMGYMHEIPEVYYIPEIGHSEAESREAANHIADAHVSGI